MVDQLYSSHKGDEAGYAFPEMLAQTDWLAERLQEPNIRIVDMDRLDGYLRMHVPGAVNPLGDQWNYIKDPLDNVHVMSPRNFKLLMESLGIGDDTMVVAYDHSRSLYAARLWWILNYYGHAQVKVLNGGWKKWFDDRLPVSRDVPDASVNVTFTPRINTSLIATTEQLKEKYDTPGILMWDVRSHEEHTGENPRNNRRAGHIPGSIHMEWLNAVDLETHMIKPANELRSMLSERRIAPEKEVIAY